MQAKSEGDKTLQAFFKSAPMLIGIVEVVGGEIIHISDNDSAASFFGHTPEFMQGKSATSLGMPAAAIKEWVDHYQHSQKAQQPVQFEYWHTSSEVQRHFSATVSFIEIGSHGHPRFSYIVQDTTEVKTTQLKLQQQEAFLETILDNIPDMIFVKEAKDLRFLLFNQAGEELIGLKKDELLGKNDFDLFPIDQARHFTSKDREVFSSHQLLEILQEPIETKFKGRRILKTKKIPLYDDQGEPLYLVGISEDITEKLQNEEIRRKIYLEQVARNEVEKLLQERDEFISIASHELKSPLSALMLKAQLFRRQIEKGSQNAYAPEKVNQLLDLTEIQVKRLERLVNDMLDVSRIRSGQLTLERKELNLYTLIKDVLSHMQEQFIQAGCGEPLLTAASLEVVGMWDSMRIEQVLVNLLTNAIRYAKGGQVEVTLSHTQQGVSLGVHDQGPGIASGDVEKIFDRFERAINRNEVSGLGLGLFISKQIVEAHGGSIRAESKPQQGASFIVELPLKPLK